MRILSLIALGAIAQTACEGKILEAETPSGRVEQAELRLGAKDPNHLAGSFKSGASSVRFESSISGTSTHFTFSRGDGSLLYTTVASASYVTTSVMGDLELSRPGATTDKDQVQQAGDGGALARFVKTPEFALLPALVTALSDVGVNGNDFPASRSLIEFGSHAKNMLEPLASNGAGRAAGDNGATGETLERRPCPAQLCTPDESWDEDSCSCVPVGPGGGESNPRSCDPSRQGDLRRNPCNDDCRGMCGPKCECWPWVCGNCNYNRGCAFHDDACDTCYKTFGVAVAHCTICWTPLAAIAPALCGP